MPAHLAAHLATPAAVQEQTSLERLEGALCSAVGQLKAATGFDGFVLDMPTGAGRPPHLIAVGTAAEIAWLLEQRAARRGEAGPFATPLPIEPEGR